MRTFADVRKLRLESLEERTLLAVTAGGFELAAALPEPAGATAWIVNTLEDSRNWDTADDILFLREAIGRAQTGDTITFDSSLAGGTITLCGSALNVYAGITIDASAIGGITIDANGQGRVFYVSGGSAENPVELISLTITGGHASDYGGGIYNYNNSTLTLTDSTVSGNTANYGGGIYNYYNSTLTLTDSTVSENTASDWGGGVYNLSATLTITNSTISGNTATDTYSSGGGIYNRDGTLTLTNTIVSENAAACGGGIRNYSTLTITNSTISGNTALYGGGIENYGTLTITNSTISGNTASDDGGGIYNDGTLTITNSTISGNTASRYGGGIRNYSTLTITNSTISGNTASSSYADGGGIYNLGLLKLTNTIVSLNYARYNNNDFFGSYSGSNNIVGNDPGFVVAPVFDESGVLTNTDMLDFSLTAKSVAIDAGTNDAVTTEYDIAGNPRIVAASADVPAVDIGAYEYQGHVSRETSSTVVTTNLDITDLTDGLISLREAIFYAETGGRITFDSSLAGQTIVLSSLELTIAKGITIDASGVCGITIDAGGQSRVFFVRDGDETSPVELIGLTITGGNSGDGSGIYNYGTLSITNSTISGNNASYYGGGICNYGTLSITNSTISGNTASGYGGGINNGGTLTITNSTISGNTATDTYSSGGGIYNKGGTLTITNSTISGNTASDEGGGIRNSLSGTLTLTNTIVSENAAAHGGGIRNYSTLTITNSTISGNNASYYGGGIYNGYGTLTITNSTISGNTATYGGGIYNNGDTLTITNSTISGNTASSYGGGIYNRDGTLPITNSTISGNTASESGGGIYNRDGTLAVTNLTVSENIATYGGGILNYGSLMLTNSTVSGNTANKKGGGIYTSTAYLYNTIVVQNAASSSGNDVCCSDGSLYAYNSLSSFTDWTVSENCPVYNPSLPLFTDPENGDYTLAKDSEAINVGNNDYITADTDLAGNHRIIGGIVDLGAYEYQLIVSTLEDIVDDQDGFISLREAVMFYSGAGDPITFSEELAGGTIILTGSEIVIDKEIKIDASSIGGITINADGKSRVFNISGGTDERPVELIGLIITGGDEEYGGGIYCSGTLSLTECTIIKNNADWGGGIFNSSGNLTLTDCAISKNSSFYFGGGIYNDNSVMRLTETIITENCGSYYGGGIYNDHSSLTAISNVISDNIAFYDGSGGGIYNHYGTLTLADCEVSRNQADGSGGGINNDTGGIATFIGCTITANGARTGGGLSNSGETNFYNTIIILNIGDKSVNDIHFSTGTVNAYNSLSSYSDWTQSDACPIFDSARALFANFFSGDYSLAKNSQVIDMGENDYVETETDLAGGERIANEIVDIGAYEFQEETPSTIVTTLQDIVDIFDGQISLREAVTLYANEGDSITFAENLAGETIILDGTDIEITKEITISAETVNDITIDANGKSRVFNISGGTDERPVELIGLIITGGDEEFGGGIYNSGILMMTNCTVSGNTASSSNKSPSYEYYGGGICNNGSLTMENCTVSQNSSECYSGNYSCGGGIFNSPKSTLMMTNCTISNNNSYCFSFDDTSLAFSCGGGIYSNVGTLTMTNCTVTDNLSFSDSSFRATSYGGGIYNNSSTLTMTNCTVSWNSSECYSVHSFGGGIYNNDSTLTLTNCTISGNSSLASSDFGGGIYNYGNSTLTMTNCTVSENSSSGICNSLNSTLMMTNCTVTRNISGWGGGIWNDGNGVLTMMNCTVTENTSNANSNGGGGIFNYNGQITIINSTIAGNTAWHDGGGISNEHNGQITIINSTIAGNTAWHGGGIYNEGSIVNVFNSIITINSASSSPDISTDGDVFAYNTLSSFTDWTDAKDCIEYNPELPLFSDFENEDLTLIKGSQAIDVGNNEYVTTATDLAGNARVIGGIVDLGAYEHSEEPFDAPLILTGNRGVYVSHGANRHFIQWEENYIAPVYELAYSTDGESWTIVQTSETSVVVSGLTYGDVISYRVRALGKNSYTDSAWSIYKSFYVCPMDIDNNGDISNSDRALVASAWLAEAGDGNFQYCCDINGDGSVSNVDRTFLSINWLSDVESDILTYPRPRAANTVFDAVFEQFETADLTVDIDVF